jgi:thiol-disulfide isomerase/thioredoxin
MEKKKKLMLLVLLFAALIAGAWALYSMLAKNMAPDQLAVQQDQSVTGASAETGSSSPSENASSEKETEEAPDAPDFTVYDENGSPVRLSDYRGKPVVLNFWASWCGPCKMEMPDFEEQYQTLGGEIQFMMVNLTDGSRETRESAGLFLEEEGYTFPVFYDSDAEAAVAYGAYSIPTTYFIDAEGKAVAMANGAIDHDTLLKGISLIAPGKSAE